MAKLVAKYLINGVAWGSLWLVVICVIFDFAYADGLWEIFENFTTHALGSVIIGIGNATTPIVYEIDRLRRWQQILIHASVGLGTFFVVAFSLGWLPMASPMALAFSLASSVIIFFAIWLGFYLYNKYEVKKLNERISAQNSKE